MTSDLEPDEAGWWWWLPGAGDGEGSLVMSAHPRSACDGRGCPLHGPSGHWARGMPLRFSHPGDRGDVRQGVMERLCPHGAWHDDPDDLDFRVSRGLGTGRRGVLPAACDCPCECGHEPPF